jgi:membrane dipeptidase
MKPFLLITALITLLAACVTTQDTDAKLLAKAQAVHARVLTLDTHKDISALMAKDPPQETEARRRFRTRFDPSYRGSNQVDFPKMREGGLNCAFFIVYVGQGPLTKSGFQGAKRSALAKFDAIDRMCEKFPDDIELALTADDVERIWKSGKLVACIGIENGYPMGEDLSLVEEFWKRGARYMGITHNRHSQLGDSHTPEEPLHGGLTDLGRKAIEEMNRVGIMVDVSHSSKKTMLEAVAHSKAPVIASHSGVHALCAHGRNLDDEQLLALKENGGVVQCVAFRSYVKDYTERNKAVRALRKELGLTGGRRRRGRSEAREDDDFDKKLATFRTRMKGLDAKYPPSSVSDFVDHIDYAVKRVGIDHVGISSDFDGGGGVDGWDNASETLQVTLELAHRGYTETQIAKIWSGNTLRVLRGVEEAARRLQ